MEDKFMNLALGSIVESFGLNNKLYLRAFELEQEASQKQFKEDTNSSTWLLGHLAWAKTLCMNLTGKPIQTTLPQWLDMFSKSIKELNPEDFPPLDEIKKVGEETHKEFMANLVTLEDDVLTAESPIKLPTSEPSILAALTYLSFHESYHIGQLSYIRRLLDKDSLIQL